MIKKILAAGVLLFGLGVSGVSAQQVVAGPNDHEKLSITYATVCSASKDMKEFLDENEYLPIFDGKNDMVNMTRKDKPSTSFAEILYSAKMKSVITIVYDKNNACILSGIQSPNINEQGVNRTLGFKN
jgi:hypothetical protein